MTSPRPLTLADAANDLKIVAEGLVAVKERLVWVRQQGRHADSIVLANGADPSAGEPGRLRAMFAAVCEGIDYAISETEKHTGIVQAYMAAHPEALGAAAPADIEASWGRFVGAFQHAQKELNELSRVL